MILVGTDDGIYRWFEGSPWLTFHSLQGQSVVGLASAGGGALAALDDAGRVWETGNNGLSWRIVPLPAGAGKATTLMIGGEPPALIVATRPLGLRLRPFGAPLPPEPKWYDRLLHRAARGTGFSAEGGLAVAARTAAAVEPDSLGWINLEVPSVPAGPVPAAIRLLERFPARQGGWYAAITGHGLWKTSDGGQTWTTCPGLPREVYSVRLVADATGTIVAGTADGCWISTDAGASWGDQSQGLESCRHVRVVEPRPDNPKHLLAGATRAEGRAASRDGLGFALYESKDGGKSWSKVGKGFPAHLQFDTIDDIRWDPAAPGFALIALGSGECWRTRSGGDWWEPIARQTRAARVLCVTS